MCFVEQSITRANAVRVISGVIGIGDAAASNE